MECSSSLTVSIILLVLSSTLTAVWGQQAVYLSLGPTMITTNNTEIIITDIGEDIEGDLPRLTCHTDLMACCRNSETGMGGLGSWSYPDGTIIPNNVGGQAFYIVRNEVMLIRLSRRTSTNAMGPTGSYCCRIPTTGGDMTICANLVTPLTTTDPPMTTMTTTTEPTTMATVTCSDLSTPENGNTIMYSGGSPGSRPVNTMATYSCMTGFTLNVGDARMCMANGEWSGTDPTCIVTTCSDLPPLANGDILYNEGSTNDRSVNTMATHSCSSGYSLSGNGVRTCGSDGMWSGTNLMCERPPVYLSLSSTDYFTNNPDIEISSIGESNEQALVCHTDLTTCCSAIEGTAAGEWVLPDNSNAPSMFMAQPTDNYFRTRDNMLIRLHRRNNDLTTGFYCCMIPTNGGDMTFCANLVNTNGPVTCSDLTEPANGMITYNSGTTNARPVDSTATFSCDSGYTLSGGGVMTCMSSGVWSGGSPTCTAVSCGSPPSINNGSPGTPTRTTFGGTVTYMCNNGYTISGSATVTCISTGSWSNRPMCTVSCGSPPPISNGSPGTPTSTLPGGTVTYNCDIGFILTGSATVTCLSTGSWSSRPMCQTPPPVYLSLSSTNYLSGLSEVPLSSIGEGSGDSLACHTDLTSCCRQLDSGVEGGLGEWYYPNGSSVQSGNDGGEIYTSRDDRMVVSLNRKATANGPGGVYCCVVPTSSRTETFCVNLVSMPTQTESMTMSTVSPSSPSPQSDNTGAVVGGVVVLVIVIVVSIATVLIAYLVLKHKRERTMELKGVPEEVALNDRGQSSPQTYETVDVAYEEIGPSKSGVAKGTYDYTQNQAYVTTTGRMREGGVAGGEGHGNPTVGGGAESSIYDN